MNFQTQICLVSEVWFKKFTQQQLGLISGMLLQALLASTVTNCRKQVREQHKKCGRKSATLLGVFSAAEFKQTVGDETRINMVNERRQCEVGKFGKQ